MVDPALAMIALHHYCDLDWMPSSRESDVIGHLNCGSGRVGSTNDSLHRKPIELL
jgi:hypothetical protein